MWSKLTQAQGAVIAAVITGIFVCFAAAINLSHPIVTNWAERQFNKNPNSNIPSANSSTSPESFSTLTTAIATNTINLGSGWTPSNISPGNDDILRVYSHYPVNSLQYVNVYVDDDLIKVEKVCAAQTSDITHLFERRTDIENPQNLPHYQSDFIRVDGCRIDFTVINNYGGNMGIDIMKVAH